MTASYCASLRAARMLAATKRTRLRPSSTYLVNEFRRTHENGRRTTSAEPCDFRILQVSDKRDPAQSILVWHLNLEPVNQWGSKRKKSKW
jgi:PleD family two-component response regulator